MKKGDKVTVRDGSYSRSVIDGELAHEEKQWRDEQFVIIEVGCKFPTTDQYQRMYDPTFNNTVIQAVDSGKVIFIEERFLKLVLPTHEIMVDMVLRPGCISGEVIKISDKLYQEIKHNS